MSPRLVLLTLLLVAPAGCLGGGDDGDDPRLAQPTDAPATVPDRIPTGPPQRPPPDLDDPGYPFTARWQVGDGWDYDSNESRWRSIRVKEVMVVNDSTFVRIDQVDGEYHGPLPVRVSSWFNASGPRLARVNATNFFTTGATHTNFTPPAEEMHFLRNGTLFWNQTEGGKRTSVAVLSHYEGTEFVSTEWGRVLAGRIEHRWSYSSSAGFTRTLVVRHVVDRWGSDAEFSVNGEIYKLTGVKYGNLQLGSLRNA